MAEGKTQNFIRKMNDRQRRGVGEEGWGPAAHGSRLDDSV